MRSVSSPRAVSISTGVSARARIRRQTSKPSRSGSMTSRRTAWNEPLSRRASPRSARGAMVTSKPLAARYSGTMAARCASSSIIRIRSDIDPDGSALRPPAPPRPEGAASIGVVTVDALREGLALLGGEDVGDVGQRLHEALRGLVRDSHLGLADLLQRRPVDGRAAELPMERIPVLLVTLSQPEEVVHGAGHDRVHAVLLLGAGVDVPQQPLAGDLEMLLGRLRTHRVAAPAAPPRVVEAGAILHGGLDRPRAAQHQEPA